MLLGEQSVEPSLFSTLTEIMAGEGLSPQDSCLDHSTQPLMKSSESWCQWSAGVELTLTGDISCHIIKLLEGGTLMMMITHIMNVTSTHLTGPRAMNLCLSFVIIICKQDEVLIGSDCMNAHSALKVLSDL